MGNTKKKILAAVDGSVHSLEAVKVCRHAAAGGKSGSDPVQREGQDSGVILRC